MVDKSAIGGFINSADLDEQVATLATNLSDCNWTWTCNHLVRKRTLNHLFSQTDPFGWVFVYELVVVGSSSVAAT